MSCALSPIAHKNKHFATTRFLHFGQDREETAPRAGRTIDVVRAARSARRRRQRARARSKTAKLRSQGPRHDAAVKLHRLRAFPVGQLRAASTEITTPSCGVVHWMDAAEAPQPEPHRDLQLELPDLRRRTSGVNNPARATGSRSSSTAAGQCGSNAAPRVPDCGTKGRSPLRRRVQTAIKKACVLVETLPHCITALHAELQDKLLRALMWEGDGNDATEGTGRW